MTSDGGEPLKQDFEGEEFGVEEDLERLGRFYAEQGFAIAWTAGNNGDANAKRVTTRDWQHTRPLTDPDFAAGLFKERGKTRDPAIVLRPSGLVAIECDGAEDLARVEELGLPATLTALSSAPDRQHRYYWPPAALEQVPFVAFRFEGGEVTADASRYFCAPPALHPSGAAYLFAPGLGPGEIEIAEMPAALYRELCKRARRAASETAPAELGECIPQGRRRNAMLHVAGKLKRVGLTEDEILPTLRELNKRCDPPLDEEELRSVAGRSTIVPAERLGADTGEEDEPVAENGQPIVVVAEPATWLERASDLLAEPDPGPTPFLVESLIVDQAIAALFGPAKAGKTWLALELARAIVTGTAALGTFTIPEPGPVIVVLEESGRAALWRRLDALRRGNAQGVEDFRDLHVSANRRVRLNDERWQEALLTAAAEIRPRAVFLDPLARLKGSDVDENVQRELGPVLDFMRDLRDASGAAVLFVHHVGHEGSRMRGSSDLLGYWESAVSLRKGEDGQRTLSAEHREAEASDTVTYRADFDPTTRSVRLKIVEGSLRTKVAGYLVDHPSASANQVHEDLGGNRQTVLDLVREIRGELDA